MFISAEYGGHCMWWKGWFDIYATLFYQYGVVHCHPGTQKLTEVYEKCPELTGEVLAHNIHLVVLVYGSKNLQQMTKMTFSSLLFVLEFMVRSITAFYSGCWYIARPKACYHCPFNKRAILNWFMCVINGRNLSWAGVEQGGHPEWVRSLWEPVSLKRGMASPTTALMQHKSTAIIQWEKTASPSATIWTLFEETN